MSEPGMALEGWTARQTISAVDTHTTGEPTHVVISGYGRLDSVTVAAKRGPKGVQVLRFVIFFLFA